MASSIDVSVPPAGTPTTAAVRANFSAAKSEIEALQAADTALGYIPYANFVRAESNNVLAGGNKDDNATNLNALFASEKYVSITTPGQYNFGAQLEMLLAGSYWFLGPGVELVKDYYSANIHTDNLIRIQAGGITIWGKDATLTGTWDYDTYVDTADGGLGVDTGRRTTECVIKVHKDPGAVDFSDIGIYFVTVRRGATYGIRVGLGTYAQPCDNLIVYGCTIEENVHSLSLACDANAPITNQKILSNKIRKSWNPVSAYGRTNATYGGNHITTTGHNFDGIEIVGNVLTDCGRMGIEIWEEGTTELDAGLLQRRVIIDRNYIGDSRYRTLSIGGDGAVTHNVVVDTNSYFEFGQGRGLEIVGNYFINTGIYCVGPSGVVDPDRVRLQFNSTKVHNNVFLNPSRNVGVVRALWVQGWSVKDNVAIYDDYEVAPPNNGSWVSPFNFTHAFNSTMEGNKLLIDSADGLQATVLQIQYCVQSSIKDFKAHWGGRYVQSSTPNSWINFEGNTHCEFDGIRLTSEKAIQCAYAAVWTFNETVTTLRVRQYDSGTSTWSDTDILTQGILNTPPGSPTNDVYYMVGVAPTGAWVGHALELALTSDGGSSWAFTQIKGFASGDRNFSQFGHDEVDGTLRGPFLLPQPWESGDAASYPAPSNQDVWVEIFPLCFGNTYRNIWPSFNGNVKAGNSWPLFAYRSSAAPGNVALWERWDGCQEQPQASGGGTRGLLISYTPAYPGVRKPIRYTASPAAADFDIGKWDTFKVQVNGNITVPAPLNPLSGMEVAFEFEQDAVGGYTVSWNAVFVGETLTGSGTSGQKAIVKFRYDGANWIQLSSTGWY